MSGLGSLYIGLDLDVVKFQNALTKSDHQTKKFTRQFQVNVGNAHLEKLGNQKP